MSSSQCKAIAHNWQSVLSELAQSAESLIQSSRRKRKMSVELLVQTLVLGSLDNEKTSLRLWSEIAAELGCDITASSIDERLTHRVVGVLYEVLQGCIRHQLSVPSLPIEQFKKLSRLILMDSTAIRLPSSLKDAFRGQSDVELGHMKLQVGYDYLAGQLCLLDVQEGRDPDQKFQAWQEYVMKDTLLVFDLGYFSQYVLETIQQHQAYFITRYQSQTCLYDPHTHAQIDLLTHLQQTSASWIEADVLLGAQTKTRVRLIARRVHAQKIAARRRRIKHVAQKQGRTASQRSLLLGAWEILVTNLPSEWTAQQIFDLYRVRWQIELLFKGWKSYLNVNELGAYRPERVLCQLFASLIGAVLCQVTFAQVRYLDTEASLFKSILIIRRYIPRLLTVIRRHCMG